MAYNPNEPRVASGPHAGEWTSGDATSAIKSAASDNKKGPLEYTPNPNLSPEHQKIETRFFNDLNNNFEQRQAEYLKENGNVISADAAKDLSPDYNKSPQSRAELAAAVHEPASAFVKKVYANQLAKPAGSNSVVFTAGGPGVGKTTGINHIQLLKSLSNQADIVYDSNLSNVRSARSKIAQALSSGRDVTIIHVHRDVIDSFENGVIPRMQRQGRSVPITEHVTRHIESLSTIKTLSKEFSSNQKVHVYYVDNSLGAGKSKLSDLATIEKKSYISDRNKILNQLHEYVKRKRESGQITEQQYKGLTTKTGPN